MIGAGDKAALVAVLNNGLDDSNQPTEHVTLAPALAGGLTPQKASDQREPGAKLLAQVLLGPRVVRRKAH